MIRHLFVLVTITLLFCQCSASKKKNLTLDTGCSLVLEHLDSLMDKNRVQYLEGYGYGISVDSIVVSSTRHALSCIPCYLKSENLSDSTLLKLHLSLTYIYDGSVELSNYYLSDTKGAEVDSMIYKVNELIWSRPDNSYSIVDILSSKDSWRTKWLKVLPKTLKSHCQ